MKRYVCYYRVSTKGQSLGLDAQQAICRQYAANNNGEIIAEYSEKESGKNDRRPEMLKAIDKANAEDAVFVVAKLDRLSRTLFGGASILESIKHIAVVNLPELNTLTKGLFLALAAYEREMISERTKQALAAMKAKGVALGKPNAAYTDEMREKALTARKENAEERSKQFIDLIRYYRGQGKTQQEIANELNAKGFKTPRGKAFAPGTIAMYLKRIDNTKQ